MQRITLDLELDKNEELIKSIKKAIDSSITIEVRKGVDDKINKAIDYRIKTQLDQVNYNYNNFAVKINELIKKEVDKFLTFYIPEKIKEINIKEIVEKQINLYITKYTVDNSIDKIIEEKADKIIGEKIKKNLVKILSGE